MVVTVVASSPTSCLPQQAIPATANDARAVSPARYPNISGASPHLVDDHGGENDGVLVVPRRPTGVPWLRVLTEQRMVMDSAQLQARADPRGGYARQDCVVTVTNRPAVSSVSRGPTEDRHETQWPAAAPLVGLILQLHL
jgi:hypothetical protein